ncbi:hypothetical protein [Arthrobacter sp. lap29]|uniref:hypothetical protein n=1 Tax=Arthrobacter sp. lap29 TaxID=3056122 RepID=UPI0028F73D39|nr:hypothetical protein [Arthrobacter sp. lap29]
MNRTVHFLPTVSDHIRPYGRRSLVGILVVFLSLTMVGQPAWAHGGQSPTEGYVMVQQALSYLVTDPSPAGTAQALTKVNDALAAKDQDGVAVAEVKQAKADLMNGDTNSGRALLQGSIKEAIAALKPAVGEETGTTIVVAPFVPPATLTVTAWVFLALSVLVAIGGTILAIRFRPSEGMRDLRRDILGAKGLRHQSSHRESTGRDKDAF